MPNEVRKATLDQYIKKKFKSEVQRFFRLPFLLGALIWLIFPSLLKYIMHIFQFWKWW